MSYNRRILLLFCESLCFFVVSLKEVSTLHPASVGGLVLTFFKPFVTDTSWCSLLFPLVTLKACLCNNWLLLEQKIVLSKICLNSGSCVCQSKNLVTQLCQVSAATPLLSSFKFLVLTFVHSCIPLPTKHQRWFSAICCSGVQKEHVLLRLAHSLSFVLS